MALSDLTGSDAATQTAREAALNGKNVIYIPPMMFPGYSGVHPGTKVLVDWIKGCGVNLYLVTEKDAQYEAWMKEKLCDGALFVDLSDQENCAANIYKAAQDSGVKFDAVFSRTENWQPVVGQLCELLGIKNNPASAYNAARNKHATRVKLEAAGLLTPKSRLVNSMEELEEALKVVPLPLVVKPTSGAGSAGVFRADTADEARMHVKAAFDAIKNSGAVLAFLPGVKASETAPVMIEQFMVPYEFPDLPAGEFDVDILMWDGKPIYCEVCDNWTPIPPYFLETGSNFPSVVPKSVQEELKEYSIKSVLALGFDRGAFHVESMYTKEGPMLIEVNPRVGGGPDEPFHQGVSDINMTKNFFMAMCGVPINPPRAATPIKTMVHYDVCCPVTGTMGKLDWLDEIKSWPWCVDVGYYVKEGDEVVGFDTALPQWIGYFMMETTPENATIAVKVAEAAAKRVYFHLQGKITTKAQLQVQRRRSFEAITAKRRGSRKASVCIDNDEPRTAAE